MVKTRGLTKTIFPGKTFLVEGNIVFDDKRKRTD